MFGKNKVTVSLIVFLTLCFLGSGYSSAAIKDSDFDGITDSAETSVYKTDPLKFDTDGDGYGDGVEVLAKSNPLDPNSTPLTVLDNKKLPLLEESDPFSWYISRISGITAFILLTLVILMGLVQTSKSLLKYKFMSFMTAMETHRALAWFGGISVVVHFSSLFFDKMFKLKVIEALIPFQLSRTFKSALGVDFNLSVSLGIIAIYFIILLIITSDLRKKVVPVKVWRLIHYISFVTYILFLVHGILSGTDTKEWWMIAIYAGSFVLVFMAFLARIFKQKLFYPKKGVSNDKTKQGTGEITSQEATLQ
jgi:sulfoxide reductase heme-binding subunit YedZ